jgi:GMP synthase (glutamine-hydrolysing)
MVDDEPGFKIEAFRDHLIEQVRDQVAGREVVCGVSGGVDSTVLAVLLHEAGTKLRAIYVDNGLMRKDETPEVISQFEELGIDIEVVDASERFLGAIDGVDEPFTPMSLKVRRADQLRLRSRHIIIEFRKF